MLVFEVERIVKKKLFLKTKGSIPSGLKGYARPSLEATWNAPYCSERGRKDFMMCTTGNTENGRTYDFPGRSIWSFFMGRFIFSFVLTIKDLFDFVYPGRYCLALGRYEIVIQ